MISVFATSDEDISDNKLDISKALVCPAFKSSVRYVNSCPIISSLLLYKFATTVTRSPSFPVLFVTLPRMSIPKYERSLTVTSEESYLSHSFLDFLISTCKTASRLSVSFPS